MLANGVFVNSNRYMLNKSNKGEREREREERKRERDRNRLITQLLKYNIVCVAGILYMNDRV